MNILNLNSYVKAVQEMGVKHAIVCNGHTHPKDLSAYAEDFSLYDMAGYMQMKEENKVFKEGTIDLCGGIMSEMIKFILLQNNNIYIKKNE